MPKRSKFNLGSYKLLTCDMGHLIPIQIKDVIPGDIFKGISQAFIRMQPMLAPVMHPIHVRIHHFFVPYRIIWDDFEDFITKNDESLYVPQIEFDSNDSGSLADYIGVPPFTDDKGKLSVNALPFRAYNMIWNEYYRDTDLQQERPVSTESGIDNTTPVDLRSVCWNKDYFTLARPWEQKGEQVAIPVYSANLPVTKYYTYEVSIEATRWWYGHMRLCCFCMRKSDSKTFEEVVKEHLVSNLLGKTQIGSNFTARLPGIYWNNYEGSGSLQSEYGDLNATFTVTKYEETDTETKFAWITGPVYVLNVPGSNVEVSKCNYNQTSLKCKISLPANPQGHISVSDLRAAIAEQRLKERKAKYGSEYSDLLASYGIGYSDARLQEPEFVSGGSSILRISEVVQTAPSETLGVVGDLKGYGLGLAKSNSYKHYFPEHGIFMSLMSVLPSTMYTTGLERYLIKTSPDEFYQREIASLVPMQEIWKKELYSHAPDEIFGFIDRYDEYRYGYSTIAGDFRDTLDYWHLGRRFTESPVLNGDFVRSTPSKRIFAEQTKHELLVMAQNMCRARRILRKKASSGGL